MNKLISALFAAVLAAVPVAAQDHGHHAPPGIGGDWKVSVDTPHGLVNGTFRFKQEGAAVTGTCELENIGAFDLAGSVDGENVSLDMQARGADMVFKLTGKLGHDQKITGSMSRPGEAHGGAFTAVRP